MSSTNPLIKVPNQNTYFSYNQLNTLIRIANEFDKVRGQSGNGNRDGFQILSDVLGNERQGNKTDLTDKNRTALNEQFGSGVTEQNSLLDIVSNVVSTLLQNFESLSKGTTGDRFNNFEEADLKELSNTETSQPGSANAEEHKLEEAPPEIIPADTRPVPPDNRPLAVIEAEHKYEEAANNVGSDFSGIESATAAKKELDDVTGYFDQLGQAIDQAKSTGDFSTLHALVPDDQLFNQVLKDHDIQPAPVVDAHQNTQDAINNVTSDFVGLDSAIAAHEEEVAVDDYFTALGKATEKAKLEGNTNALFNPETGTGLVSYEQAVQFANENGIAPPNINIDLNGAV